MPRSTPLPRDFYLVTAANFVFFLNFATFFLLPVHLHELGVSEQTIGRVMGTGGFAGIAMLPFLGVLLDRVSRRGFTTAGAFVMAVASLAYLVAPDTGPVLYLLRVLQGASFTAGFVTASTLAAELAPPAERARALGIFGISTLVTHAIAPTVGEVVARHLGFDVLFAIAGCLGLLAALLTLAVHEPPRAHVPAAERRPLGRDPTLWLAAATMLACGLGFGTVLTFAPTFVHAIGLGHVAPFFLAYTGAAVSVRFGLGGLSDRVGRRRVLLPSMVLFTGAILALGAVTSVPALVFVGLAFGAGHGMIYPTANALMVDLADPTNMGRVQTLFAGSFSVGSSISAFVFGTVIERFGYGAAFAAAAGCVAVGTFLLWLAPREAEVLEDVLEEALEIEGDA